MDEGVVGGAGVEQIGSNDVRGFGLYQGWVAGGGGSIRGWRGNTAALRLEGRGLLRG